MESTASSRSALAIHLTSRPDGPLTAEHLAVVETSPPRLTPGMVSVENLWFSIEPPPSPETVKSWTVHRPVDAGPTIGRVSRSRAASVPVGSLVMHREGWATRSVLVVGSYESRLLDPLSGLHATAYLSALGMSGLSAYIGLTEILKLEPGESIFVADVEEPFGAIAARLARAMDAGYVVGGVISKSASAPMAREAEVDAVVGLVGADSPPSAPLSRAHEVDAALIGPGNVYFEAALASVREYGRIAWAHGPAPDARRRDVGADSLARVHTRSVRVDGYQPRHFLHLQRKAQSKLSELLLEDDSLVGSPQPVGFAELIDALVRAAEQGYVKQTVYQLGCRE